MKKRGQMKISFGMIFSIILIIIFLSFSFAAIKKFVSISNSAKLAQFKDDFQEDMDRLWRGSRGNQSLEYNIPSKITHVCFADYTKGPGGDGELYYDEMERYFFEYENMFIFPPESAEGLEATTINHLNLDETTRITNPLCIENKKGTITLKITKDYGESLVTISR
ncbi:hypothetical protein ISS08_00210 [Candidatus Pacearchaeota archaeon]|nr:hypothetical protein [Candidatus Pacearchaeota archaeon]